MTLLAITFFNTWDPFHFTNEESFWTKGSIFLKNSGSGLVSFNTSTPDVFVQRGHFVGTSSIISYLHRFSTIAVQKLHSAFGRNTLRLFLYEHV